MKTQSVREQLIEHALVLIRRRGFNGFSYRDLAELVGVKTSSIHYYFPSKDDLVLEAVREYSARTYERIRAIDTNCRPPNRRGSTWSRSARELARTRPAWWECSPPKCCRYPSLCAPPCATTCTCTSTG